MRDAASQKEPAVFVNLEALRCVRRAIKLRLGLARPLHRQYTSTVLPDGSAPGVKSHSTSPPPPAIGQRSGTGVCVRVCVRARFDLHSRCKKVADFLVVDFEEGDLDLNIVRRLLCKSCKLHVA